MIARIFIVDRLKKYNPDSRYIMITASCDRGMAGVLPIGNSKENRSAPGTRELKQRKTILGEMGEKPLFWHLEAQKMKKRKDLTLKKGGLTSLRAKKGLAWGKETISALN